MRLPTGRNSLSLSLSLSLSPCMYMYTLFLFTLSLGGMSDVCGCVCVCEWSCVRGETHRIYTIRRGEQKQSAVVNASIPLIREAVLLDEQGTK